MYGASHGPYPSSVGSTVRGPDEVSLLGRPLTVQITATTKKIPNPLALYIIENDGTNIGCQRADRSNFSYVRVENQCPRFSYGSGYVTLRPQQVASAFAKKRGHAAAAAPHSRAEDARARVTGHRHFWELDLET